MRTLAGARVGALLIGFLSGVNFFPASAAVPDLDERLAELEATAAPWQAFVLGARIQF